MGMGMGTFVKKIKGMNQVAQKWGGGPFSGSVAGSPVRPGLLCSRTTPKSIAFSPPPTPGLILTRLGNSRFNEEIWKRTATSTERTTTN